MVDLHMDQRGGGAPDHQEREATAARVDCAAAQHDEASLDRDLGLQTGEAQVLGAFPCPQDRLAAGLGASRQGAQRDHDQAGLARRSHVTSPPQSGLSRSGP